MPIDIEAGDTCTELTVGVEFDPPPPELPAPPLQPTSAIIKTAVMPHIHFFIVISESFFFRTGGV
jgi:hypothetical protein